MPNLHDFFCYAVDIICEYGILQQISESSTMIDIIMGAQRLVLKNYLLTCIRLGAIFVDRH